MQENVYKFRTGKQIIIAPADTKRLAKSFRVSENTILNAFRYDTMSELAQTIRETAFAKYNAQVRVLRPMAKYDIYLAKELGDPNETNTSRK